MILSARLSHSLIALNQVLKILVMYRKCLCEHFVTFLLLLAIMLSYRNLCNAM